MEAERKIASEISNRKLQDSLNFKKKKKKTRTFDILLRLSSIFLRKHTEAGLSASVFSCVPGELNPKNM